ncbi:transmembrane alpha-helix domain-containing protein [Fusarium flagelliforme]|uniref:Transmembrane alpha-helix domain-containing protein n=1 Tax=Fusarium flagelliforme TaxID=2675880 RepID=A0A395MLX0_9HYPO|nr:transmembrane alpha-helix domain-containing protein [Fusarium flagelliforme]
MSDPVPATELNPNVWYHVTEQNVDKDYKTNWRSILQINQDPKVKDDNLHVWPVKTDDGNVSAFWQFQPMKSTPGRYMLRYSQTGADVQLSVCLHSDVDEKDTKTRPCLRNATNHETQQWDIFEFKSNSSYRLINVHKGTGYHMDCMPSGSVFMSPDVDDRPYQSAQHWLMTSASNVDDNAYSTTASENPSSTSSERSMSTADLVSESSDHKGLSSGTITGIAIGVVLGVIVVVGSLAAYFIWRSRKRRNGATSSSATTTNNDWYDNALSTPTYKARSPKDEGRSTEPVEIMDVATNLVAAELPGTQRYELA